jgi:hypothetical protein
MGNCSTKEVIADSKATAKYLLAAYEEYDKLNPDAQSQYDALIKVILKTAAT